MLKKNLPLVMWLIFVIYVVYGTLIPFDFSFQSEDIARNIRQANYIPFYSEYLKRRWSIPDIVSNILLFIPYGFLLYWELQNRGIRAGKNRLICTLSAFLFSSMIEFLQLFSMTRAGSEITDIINNTLGAYTGCILSHIFLLRWKDKFFEQLNILRQKNPLLIFLILYSLLILLGFMFPFNISIDIDDIRHALRRTNLIPFAASNLSFINIGLNIFPFIIFGFIGYAALRIYSSKAIPKTIFWGGCLALLIEICQIFMVSRFDINEIIVRVAGTLLGVLTSVVNFYRR